MTGSISIVFLILSVLQLSRCQMINPIHTLNYFCPCEEVDECRTVFGGGGNLGHVYQDILQAIPACRKHDEVRCCTKDSMFTAIMIIMNSQESHLPKNRDLSPPPGSVLAASDRAAGTQNVAANQQPLFPPEVSQAANLAPRQQNFQVQSRLFQTEGSQTNSQATQDRLFAAPDLSAQNVQTLNFPAFSGNAAPPGERSDDAEASRLLGLLTSVAGVAPGQPADVPTGRALPEGVQCVSFSECTPNNIYGTNPAHFTQFGIISPTEANCLANSGKILCVKSGGGGGAGGGGIGGGGNGGSSHNHGHTDRPQPQVSVPLPCVDSASCLEVFGSKSNHVTRFGSQAACPNARQVRCVTAGGAPSTAQPPVLPTSRPIPTLRPSIFRPTSVPRPSTARPAATTLQCLPANRCSEVYGSKGFHFTRYGIQQPCPDKSAVRCVTPGGGGGTSPGGGGTTPGGGTSPGGGGTSPGGGGTSPGGGGTSPGGGGTSTGGGGISTGGGGPVAPSVSIIGPQPIYVSYNEIKGPSVGHGGVDSVGSVHSSGVGAGQQAQIDSLLKVLKQRLKAILSG